MMMMFKFVLSLPCCRPLRGSFVVAYWNLRMLVNMALSAVCAVIEVHIV